MAILRNFGEIKYLYLVVNIVISNRDFFKDRESNLSVGFLVFTMAFFFEVVNAIKIPDEISYVLLRFQSARFCLKKLLL